MRLQEVSTFSDSATSLGAAAAAGVGIGLFRDLSEAASKITVSGSTEVQPALSAIYERTKRRYELLYPSLREAFRV